MATSPEISIGAVPAKDLRLVVAGTAAAAKKIRGLSSRNPQEVSTIV